jgi:hypothetical protein
MDTQITSVTTLETELDESTQLNDSVDNDNDQH